MEVIVLFPPPAVSTRPDVFCLPSAYTAAKVGRLFFVCRGDPARYGSSYLLCTVLASSLFLLTSRCIAKRSQAYLRKTGQTSSNANSHGEHFNERRRRSRARSFGGTITTARRGWDDACFDGAEE